MCIILCHIIAECDEGATFNWHMSNVTSQEQCHYNNNSFHYLYVDLVHLYCHFSTNRGIRNSRLVENVSSPSIQSIIDHDVQKKPKNVSANDSH